MSQDNDIMARFEQESHSFVIRLWREHQENENAAYVWRGWVKHVQSNRRYYFTDGERLQRILHNYLIQIPDLQQIFEKVVPYSPEKIHD